MRQKAKNLYRAAAVAMVFTAVVTPSDVRATEATNSAFTDVSVENSAYDAIQWAKSRGIITGYTDGTFKPNEAVTEAQFVKMLVHYFRLEKTSINLKKANTFTHWSDVYYATLATYATPLNGYFLHIFRNEAVQRGVVAQAMNYLISGEIALLTSMQFFFKHAIISGEKTTNERGNLNASFSAQSNLTRAQMVLLLYRIELANVGFISNQVLSNQAANIHLNIIDLANKGIRTLDDSIRIGPIGEEVKPVDVQLAPIKKNAHIPITSLLQKPELPHGCEIVSLTAVLNYYGYRVSKMTMADNYLPKIRFAYRNGKLYGANPNKAYAGEPSSATKGWYSFAAPIVQASNNFMKTQTTKLKAANISGSSKEQILNYLNKGVPVVIWVTLDLSMPVKGKHWYLSDTGELYYAYTNLHCVVLNAYKDNIVQVMDPLKGLVTYKMDAFFKSYEQLGKHAMVVEK